MLHVKKKNRKSKKLIHILLNLNVACFVMFQGTDNVTIFIRTSQLVTKRSRHADFYFINEGTQDICTCSVNIY